MGGAFQNGIGEVNKTGTERLSVRNSFVIPHEIGMICRGKLTNGDKGHDMDSILRGGKELLASVAELTPPEGVVVEIGFDDARYAGPLLLIDPSALRFVLNEIMQPSEVPETVDMSTNVVFVHGDQLFHFFSLKNSYPEKLVGYSFDLTDDSRAIAERIPAEYYAGLLAAEHMTNLTDI